MESTETLPGLLSYAPCGQDDPASQLWTRGRINPLACNGSVPAGLPEKAGSWEEQETTSTLRATSSERKSGVFFNLSYQDLSVFSYHKSTAIIGVCNSFNKV